MVFVFIFQCAATMDVRVGSFSEPEGIEGLAHFLGEFYVFIQYSVLDSIEWNPNMHAVLCICLFQLWFMCDLLYCNAAPWANA